MKRKYAHPQVIVEEFTPNEYVAACWKIKCNVPKGFGYIETNGKEGYQETSKELQNVNGKWQWVTVPGDQILTPHGVSGCGVWHTGVEGVPDDGPTANAMWHPSNGSDDYSVYYWRDGEGTYDIHFSKVSDAQWASNPNAS